MSVLHDYGTFIAKERIVESLYLPNVFQYADIVFIHMIVAASLSTI
jgi:hypothetical protein